MEGYTRAHVSHFLPVGQIEYALPKQQYFCFSLRFFVVNLLGRVERMEKKTIRLGWEVEKGEAVDGGNWVSMGLLFFFRSVYMVLVVDIYLKVFRKILHACR